LRLSRLLEIGTDRLFAVTFLAAVTVATSFAQDRKAHDWSVYDGDPAGDHYSSLAQINRQNVM
jgi:glucose dehydrogenase